MAEAAFSEDGKYYSAISQDGRLRIWDTETNVLKQEYTPDLHLTSPPSCLQWINVSTSVTPQKGKRKSSISGQWTQCIVLGTTSGKILIYAVAEAKVQTVLNQDSTQNNQKKITCLDWSRDYGLFSCSRDNFVHEWDLGKNSEKHKYNVNVDNKNKQGSSISAIKIIPHNQDTSARYLITASWQLRVFRLFNGTATLIKSLGHNAAAQAILSIATLNDKTWLIEGSQNERLLSFWDVTITGDVIPQINGDGGSPKKKQRKKSISDTTPITPTTSLTPTYNFVLEDAPKMIDVTLKEDGDTKLTLAAATRSGVVHYYSHVLNGSSTKPIKPSLTIHITTADATPLPLQCCRLPADGDLQVGYISGVTTVFERLTPDLSSKTQVIIRGDAKPKKAKQAKKNEINKVRADDAAEPAYTEPMGGVVNRKRPTPGGKVEVPMEARLANLALDTTSRRMSAVNQNQTRLLVQALHSKDRKLLLMVLKDDRGLAARTVSQLTPEYIPPLLEFLAEMATLTTSNCAAVCTWAGAVVRCHSSLLLAAMNSPVADHLSKLLAVFSDRRSHLCQLLNLKGRLELTVAQRARRDTSTAAVDQEPVIDYNDTSDEEMEADKPPSEASDASWDDDKFDDSEDEEEEE